MVLGLPLFIPLAGLSPDQYGVLAGLTVYAVPQVLAATVPAGLLATQVGTLVKLVRVLMLGPVVVGLSLVAPRRRGREPSRPSRALGFPSSCPGSSSASSAWPACAHSGSSRIAGRRR